MSEIFQTDNAPKPVGPYSQAVKAGGWLFVSGQLGIDPMQGKIVAVDIAGQTKQVLENIEEILKAANYKLGDVVKTEVFLSSIELFKEFNIEYAKYFLSNAPARVTVAAELPLNALVEISVTAYQPV